MFSSESWLSNQQAGFYNGVATQSVRLDDGSSAYLTFTPSSASSATDRRKVTHSVWVKRGVLGTDQTIYSGNRSGGGDYYLLRFSSDNKLTLILDVDAGGYGYDTTAVYRDVGAWYHVCVIIDTTQVTDTNRVKIYVNGVLQDKSTKYAGGHVPLDFSTYVMDGNEDEVGRFAFTGASYFDGYMAEFITTIGQDNTISEFGELKNSVWIPIDYAGSYGGNGFRFEFNKTGIGTGSTTTIGADTSGNLNHWDSSGIDTEDCDMPDSPENNFCTLNPNARGTTNVATSEGNLKFVKSGANFGNVLGTMPLFSGKWYCEAYITSSNLTQVGVQEITNNIYQNSGNFGANTDLGMWDSRGFFYDEGTAGGSVPTYTTGDIIGIAFDVEAGKIWFAKNGTYLFSGDPANGTNQSTGSTNNLSSIGVTIAGNGENGGTAVYNCGQDGSFAGNKTTGSAEAQDANGNGDFYYTPPSGYLALCTANLPEPTISPNADTQADNYFGVLTWSGDDNASRTIATGGSGVSGSVDFTPDWAWIKRRNGSSNGSDHLLLDIVRGVGSFNGLTSNASQAEGLTEAGSTWANFGDISAFATDGFTVQKGSDPSHTLEGINQSGGTYVGWNWKAGGTAVSNTQGSINSSVSANTDAGFSIVTYTGTRTSDAGETGTPTTIGHGLGKKPAVVITKARETTTNARWNVWHQGYQPDQTYLNYQIWLNQTDGSNNAGWQRTDTGFSTTTFCPARYSWDDVLGIDYVAYCFAEIEGFSKFGTYTGNNATDGNMIFTNFSPALVIIKYTSGAAGGTKNWYMWDNTRSPQNTNDNILYSNAISTEGADSAFDIDFLSNGFKLRNAEGGVNNGAEYIYMAWASNPFKYANAR